MYKKGDKSQPSNYRPISLTSVACKLLEHIIHSNLMKFFEEHNILSQYQHGFRKHHSCESQLITTVHDLVTGLDKSQQIYAILLDFSKAFDKVPRQRLLIKLQHYGVRNNTLKWIQFPQPPKPASVTGWSLVQVSPCNIQSPPRHRTRPSSVPGLYQRPSRASQITMSPLCRRLSAI